MLRAISMRRPRRPAMPAVFARRRANERGTVLVEMTLAMPLLVALLLGTFTGGTAYFQKIGIADATREGARYGATLDDRLTGGLTTWRDNVKARVVSLAGGAVTTADVCADLVTPTALGNTSCGVADPPGAYSAESSTRIVKVKVTKSGTMQWFFLSSSIDLSAKNAARYERDTG